MAVYLKPNGIVFFSECCWGPARVLADEVGERSWSKEWCPCCVWVSAHHISTLCVLRQPAGWKLLWQFSGNGNFDFNILSQCKPLRVTSGRSNTISNHSFRKYYWVNHSSGLSLSTANTAIHTAFSIRTDQTDVTNWMILSDRSVQVTVLWHVYSIYDGSVSTWETFIQ